MAKSILHTIERNMPTFSKGQKRIADYILQNYDKAAFMTASKLGSSPASASPQWYASHRSWGTTAIPVCSGHCRR
ncbi:MAG: hypothetical protein ACLUIW_11595 [Dysosmobacter welbionis]